MWLKQRRLYILLLQLVACGTINAQNTCITPTYYSLSESIFTNSVENVATYFKNLGCKQTLDTIVYLNCIDPGCIIRNTNFESCNKTDEYFRVFITCTNDINMGVWIQTSNPNLYSAILNSITKFRSKEKKEEGFEIHITANPDGLAQDYGTGLMAYFRTFSTDLKYEIEFRYRK